MENNTEILDKELPDSIEVDPVESETALLAEAESGILPEFIKKSYPVLGAVKIYHPTLDIDSEVSTFYVKEFNKFLRSGEYPSLKRMEKILKESEEWTDQDDKEIDNLIQKITNTQIDLAQLRVDIKMKPDLNKDKTYIKNFTKLTDKINQLNHKLLEITVRKSSLFQGTAEKQAENKSLYLKLIRCVKDSEDKPIWNSLEEVGKFRGDILKKVILDASKFWRGVSGPLSDDLLDLISGV